MSEGLAERAAAGDRHAVARLVSLVEDARPVSRERQRAELSTLSGLLPRHGRIVGVTGAPGSGKSSLLARVTEHLLELDGSIRVAVVAVDPSSPASGGALLGDRTRMRPTDTDRLFIRSQASANALGGLAPSTHRVCVVLRHLFDLVLVETVGVGQSEADIRHLAHDVLLVVGPLAGDEIQFLKAGVIEVPDAFVVSKWDEPAARSTFHQLRSSLSLARPFDADDVRIFTTSAATGHGIDELSRYLLERRHEPAPDDDGVVAARYFFRRWVTEEWGRVGLRHLDSLGGAEALVDDELGAVGARAGFERSLLAALASRTDTPARS